MVPRTTGSDSDQLASRDEVMPCTRSRRGSPRSAWPAARSVPGGMGLDRGIAHAASPDLHDIFRLGPRSGWMLSTMRRMVWLQRDADDFVLLQRHFEKCCRRLADAGHDGAVAIPEQSMTMASVSP